MYGVLGPFYYRARERDLPNLGVAQCLRERHDGESVVTKYRGAQQAVD